MGLTIECWFVQTQKISGSNRSAEVYFTAALLEGSLSNLFKLSLKGRIWLLKRVGAEETQVEVEVSPDAREHLQIWGSALLERASRTVAPARRCLDDYWRRKTSSRDHVPSRDSGLLSSQGCLIGNNTRNRGTVKPTNKPLGWRCAPTTTTSFWFLMCHPLFQFLTWLPEQDRAGMGPPFVKTGTIQDRHGGRRRNGNGWGGEQIRKAF